MYWNSGEFWRSFSLLQSFQSSSGSWCACRIWEGRAVAKPADFGQGLVSGFNSWTSWVWLFAGLLSGFQETASGYQDEMDDGRHGRLNCAFATVCRMSYAGQSVRQSVLQPFLIFSNISKWFFWYFCNSKYVQMIFHTLCMQEAWNCRAAAPRTVAVRRLQESALSQLQSCQAAKLCFPIVNFRAFRVPNLPWKIKPQSTSRSLWRTMKCFVHHWSSLAGFHKCSRCLASPNKCDAPHHGDFANELTWTYHKLKKSLWMPSAAEWRLSGVQKMGCQSCFRWSCSCWND